MADEKILQSPVMAISYIVEHEDFSLCEDNALTKTHFFGYEDQYEFIKNYYDKYGCVPDRASFISKFSDFEFVEVGKSSKQFIVDSLRDDNIFRSIRTVNELWGEKLDWEHNSSLEILRKMKSDLDAIDEEDEVQGEDIIHNATRLEKFKNFRDEKNGRKLIPTGFQELDGVLGGWEVSEEFVVIFARTNQGKSWILLKTLQHAWQIGLNVGFISPEMSADRLGFRFDTLQHGFSNTALMRGDTDVVKVEDYESYIEGLNSAKNSFYVATPKEFNREITISKLRAFIKSHHLDILAIDGLTYLKDERGKRHDNKTTTLTNISEDLMDLSCELEIPILCVLQSNRNGVKDDDNDVPELTDIRDSDGPAQNASKVISLKQANGQLIMSVQKQRYGKVGDKLAYTWDIDIGDFKYTTLATKTVEKPQERQRHIPETASNKRTVF